MDRIHTYVICNHGRHVAVGDVARFVGMNKSAFCVFFRKMAGKTFVQYLNEYRIQMACRMLEKGDPIRPEVCRLLFHVPLSNLLRREERALNLDPVNSAIPAGREESPHAVPERKEVPPPAKRKSIGQSAAPVHTVEVYERPDRHAYDGYIGNTDVVSTIERQLDGAILRGDPLRPFLLRGASGVGKTELARRTARRLGRRLFRVTASVLKSGDDVHNLLATMSSGDVLLIDEAQELGA